MCRRTLQLDANKNLVSQCVQGCGLVQVNVEIKTVLGGSLRINITDVLKPADEDDEEDDVKPDIGMCCFPCELGRVIVGMLIASILMSSVVSLRGGQKTCRYSTWVGERSIAISLSVCVCLRAYLWNC